MGLCKVPTFVTESFKRFSWVYKTKPIKQPPHTIYRKFHKKSYIKHSFNFPHCDPNLLKSGFTVYFKTPQLKVNPRVHKWCKQMGFPLWQKKQVTSIPRQKEVFESDSKTCGRISCVCKLNERATLTASYIWFKNEPLLFLLYYWQLSELRITDKKCS